VTNWLIYGAPGFTGRRIAAEAKHQGLSPILAGRTLDPLNALGRELDLPTRCFSLGNKHDIKKTLADIKIVVNAAGPFFFTATALRECWIETATHYLDISGEMDVLSETIKNNDAAKAAGVLIVSGAVS